MQNEADSNVLHAWLHAAQSQVAVLSRHRLEEHGSRAEAERHKQNADELERRHLGLLREHARLAHQMRTQLEAAERRALDAEESAARMDEERHQWRARVSVLEEKVAGLTSALGEYGRGSGQDSGAGSGQGSGAKGRGQIQGRGQMGITAVHRRQLDSTRGTSSAREGIQGRGCIRRSGGGGEGAVRGATSTCA